jgi:hypothetical protein
VDNIRYRPAKSFSPLEGARGVTMVFIEDGRISAGSIGVPQVWQNPESSVFSLLHLGHITVIQFTSQFYRDFQSTPEFAIGCARECHCVFLEISL